MADSEAPIINLFTPEFLTQYITFAMRRPVGRRILYGTEARSDVEECDPLFDFEMRVRSVDVVAIGSYRPEWMVALRIGTDGDVSAEDFAVALNSLAKSHLPAYNRYPCFAWSEDGVTNAPLTPFATILELLEEFAPRGISFSFKHGVVDSRAKVIGFAPHDEPDVSSEAALRAALGLAGAVHSVSGMKVESVLQRGHAVPIDLFNNWVAACTLDGIGIVFDPEDEFASDEFRTQVLDAYWLVYADAIGDVASVDRFLRRPILDLRRRRELLGELTEFGQLNRQWSARGANAFPVAASIRSAVERLHGLDQRLVLAQRRAESISAGVIAVANHRFNKVLILVAVLTAGNVVQALSRDQDWLASLPLAAFVTLIAALVLVFDARPRTIGVTLTAGLGVAAGGVALARTSLLESALHEHVVLLVGAFVGLGVAATMSTFYRDR